MPDSDTNSKPILADKRILVTGGRGFLGQAVLRRLDDVGCRDVSAPSPQSLNLEDWHTSTAEWFSVKGPNVIIHCAAVCGGIGANGGNERDFLVRNLQMGMNALKGATIRRIWGDSMSAQRFINIGSVCAYPLDCPQPMREDDLWDGWPEPTNAYYGIAKRTVMAAVDAYHKQYGLNGLNLILTNLYGPGDNFDLQTSHVIPAMMRKMIEAGPVGTVTLWGDGKPTRDVLFVDDAAEAIVEAAGRDDVQGTINIASGSSYPIAVLARAVANTVGFDGQVDWDTSKPNGQPKRMLDTSRAAELLGWSAKTSPREGLRKTYEWYKKNTELCGMRPISI